MKKKALELNVVLLALSALTMKTLVEKKKITIRCFNINFPDENFNLLAIIPLNTNHFDSTHNFNNIYLALEQSAGRMNKKPSLLKLCKVFELLQLGVVYIN